MNKRRRNERKGWITAVERKGAWVKADIEKYFLADEVQAISGTLATIGGAAIPASHVYFDNGQVLLVENRAEEVWEAVAGIGRAVTLGARLGQPRNKR